MFLTIWHVLIFLLLAYVVWQKVIFFVSICLPIHSGVCTLAGGTYPAWWREGVPTLARGYLIWLGVPTLAWSTYHGKGYLPRLGRYLPWPRKYLPLLGVPTLAEVGVDTYLELGVPTLASCTYLGWKGTFSGWGGRRYLPWIGGTYPGQGRYLP